MSKPRREREPARPNPVWLVDLLFWVTVAGVVLTAAFFMTHEFGPCNPEFETCFTD